MDTQPQLPSRRMLDEEVPRAAVEEAARFAFHGAAGRGLGAPVCEVATRGAAAGRATRPVGTSA